MNEPAFLVEDYGSIVAVHSHFGRREQGVDAGLIEYEEWQLMGCSIMVNHCVADGLLNHLWGDGFTIGVE